MAPTVQSIPFVLESFPRDGWTEGVMEGSGDGSIDGSRGIVNI